jgi:hypothetical protein
MKIIALVAAAALGSAALGSAALGSAALAAPVLSRTAGKILKSSTKTISGIKGPVMTAGRITILDDAGHQEEFAVDKRTRITCDGKKTAFLKSAVPGACDRAVKILYDLQTKRVSVLELRTAAKADADDAAGGRAAVSGEVAATDVLGGKISVRLGGGNTLDFAVGDGTKIVREAAGKPAAAIPLEAVKVGDRVEVHSKDWKTADEIHVRAPAR